MSAIKKRDRERWTHFQWNLHKCNMCIYILTDGGTENEFGYAYTDFTVEGQGCCGNEYCCVAFISEPQCDYCGSSYGQREFYEAFRKWVQATVSLSNSGYWSVVTHMGRMRNMRNVYAGIQPIWHIRAASLWPNVFYLTSCLPRCAHIGRCEINLLFSICCRQHFM